MQGFEPSWISFELRPRDSNPDYLVQSEACCHYTRPQSESEGYRRPLSWAAAGLGPTRLTPMFILIVGCGRVGSSVARSMLSEGHEVSCLDEDPESHARLEVGLDKGWEDLGGQFTVGAGLETDALVAAGIERADAFIASTDGDNTNIVIAQIAQRRYNVPTVIARILDPLRAEWYERQGMHTVCPTRVAIDMLESAVREGAVREAS